MVIPKHHTSNVPRRSLEFALSSDFTLEFGEKIILLYDYFHYIAEDDA